MILKAICTALGLIFGFLAGLGVLNIVLKDKTRDELKTDKYLQRKYGSLCWLIALCCAYIGWWLSQQF